MASLPSYHGRRSPDKNAHIEASHRVSEDEYLSRYEFRTYAEAYEQVASNTDFYNTTRMHSSLGLMAPDECYQAIQSGDMKLPPVRG